jgi:hypothetical protein
MVSFLEALTEGVTLTVAGGSVILKAPSHAGKSSPLEPRNLSSRRILSPSSSQN